MSIEKSYSYLVLMCKSNSRTKPGRISAFWDPQCGARAVTINGEHSLACLICLLPEPLLNLDIFGFWNIYICLVGYLGNETHVLTRISFLFLKVILCHIFNILSFSLLPVMWKSGVGLVYLWCHVGTQAVWESCNILGYKCSD